MQREQLLLYHRTSTLPWSHPSRRMHELDLAFSSHKPQDILVTAKHVSFAPPRAAPAAAATLSRAPPFHRRHRASTACTARRRSSSSASRSRSRGRSAACCPSSGSAAACSRSHGSSASCSRQAASSACPRRPPPTPTTARLRLPARPRAGREAQGAHPQRRADTGRPDQHGHLGCHAHPTPHCRRHQAADDVGHSLRVAATAAWTAAPLCCPTAAMPSLPATLPLPLPGGQQGRLAARPPPRPPRADTGTSPRPGGQDGLARLHLPCLRPAAPPPYRLRPAHPVRLPAPRDQARHS